MPTPVEFTGTGSLPEEPHVATDGAIRSAFPILAGMFGVDDLQGLSPEFLVEIAQQRLGAIDGQIQEMMTAMNNRSATLNQLRSASQIVEAFRSAPHADGDRIDMNADFPVRNPDGSTRHTTLAAELQSAGINPGPFCDEHGSGPAHNDLEGLTTEIRNATEQVQQGSEIEQMHLQQLVQSRGQIVQMCSQIMASMHETDKGIVANIRA